MYKMLNQLLKCTMLFLFLFAFMANPMMADELKSKDLNTAAEAGLPYYLNLIPENDLASYGFNNNAELERARLGNPYELHMISAQLLNDATTSADQALEFTYEMRFPVMVDGQYRALLTVGKKDNLWSAIGFGAAVLASELQTMENSLNISNERGSAPKLLVRYLQGKCDFVMVKDNARSLASTQLYPVNSGASFLMSASTAYQASYTLDDIKSLIHR